MYPQSFLCEETKIQQDVSSERKLCETSEKAIWNSRFTSCIFFFFLSTKSRNKPETYHCYVTELVSRCNGIVIEYASSSDPPWMCVVGENNKLILLTFVSHGIHGFLYIAYVYTLTHSVYRYNGVWYMLVLTFPQQLLFTHVIKSQHSSNTHEYATLIRTNRERYLVDNCLVHQFHWRAICVDSVNMKGFHLINVLGNDQSYYAKDIIVAKPQHCRVLIIKQKVWLSSLVTRATTSFYTVKKQLCWIANLPYVNIFLFEYRTFVKLMKIFSFFLIRHLVFRVATKNYQKILNFLKKVRYRSKFHEIQVLSQVDFS